MQTIVRHFRLWRVFASASATQGLEYRFSAYVEFLNIAVATLSMILIYWTLFDGGNRSMAGWTLSQTIVLTGIYVTLEGLMEQFITYNVSTVPEMIRTGTMDHVLLKPVNGQFLITFQRIGRIYHPQIWIGGALTVYGMTLAHTLSWVNLATLGVMTFSATLILYAAYFSSMMLAFRWVNIEPLGRLAWVLLEAGRFPVSIFPRALRLLLTFGLPVAFVTTVPAEAALGRLDIVWMGASIAVAALSLAGSQWAWRRAVASYSSASS